MKTFKQYLGPEATKQHDKEEISRQKTHLSNKAKEYYAQSEREGGGGAAKAKGDSFAAAKENIHNEEFKVGDKVKPNAGPHAGEEHEVIHVHADGRVNIKPTKSTHVKYHLGAAMAQPHQLTLSEMDSQGYTGTREVDAHKGLKEDGGAMGVAAVAGSGVASLPPSQREPGVSKKRNPVLKGLFRRNPPKV